MKKFKVTSLMVTILISAKAFGNPTILRVGDANAVDLHSCGGSAILVQDIDLALKFSNVWVLRDNSPVRITAPFYCSTIQLNVDDQFQVTKDTVQYVANPQTIYIESSKAKIISDLQSPSGFSRYINVKMMAPSGSPSEEVQIRF